MRANAEEVAKHEDARAIERIGGGHAARFQRARGERAQRRFGDQGHRVIPR